MLIVGHLKSAEQQLDVRSKTIDVPRGVVETVVNLNNANSLRSALCEVTLVLQVATRTVDKVHRSANNEGCVHTKKESASGQAPPIVKTLNTANASSDVVSKTESASIDILSL